MMTHHVQLILNIRSRNLGRVRSERFKWPAIAGCVPPSFARTTAGGFPGGLSLWIDTMSEVIVAQKTADHPQTEKQHPAIDGKTLKRGVGFTARLSDLCTLRASECRPVESLWLR